MMIQYFDPLPGRKQFGITYEVQSGRPVNYMASFNKKKFTCAHCGGPGENTSRRARFCNKEECQRERIRVNNARR